MRFDHDYFIRGQSCDPRWSGNNLLRKNRGHDLSTSSPNYFSHVDSEESLFIGAQNVFAKIF